MSSFFRFSSTSLCYRSLKQVTAFTEEQKGLWQKVRGERMLPLSFFLLSDVWRHTMPHSLWSSAGHSFLVTAGRESVD